jgi:hypothetical protein
VRMLCGGRGRRVDGWRSANNVVPFFDHTEILGVVVTDNLNTPYSSIDNREVDSNIDCLHGVERLSICHGRSGIVWEDDLSRFRGKTYLLQSGVLLLLFASS